MNRFLILLLVMTGCASSPRAVKVTPLPPLPQPAVVVPPQAKWTPNPAWYTSTNWSASPDYPARHYFDPKCQKWIMAKMKDGTLRGFVLRTNNVSMIMPPSNKPKPTMK